MIVTVTLNPSLDYYMNCPAPVLGATNRSKAESIRPGGKGINVAAVLRELNIPVIALSVTGGFTGRELEAGVRAMGIPAEFIHLNGGTTRINVKLRGDCETEVNAAGPRWEPEAQTQAEAYLRRLKKGDILVLSGGLPAGAPVTLYADWLKLTDPEVPVVVDTTGAAMKACLPAHPFLVKPNGDELCALYGEENRRDPEQIRRLALQMQGDGATNILVSLGAEGSLLLTADGQWLTASAARGQVVSTVGAGDSMIAGFLAGLGKDFNFRRALLLGTACGGATAFSEGLATAETVNTVLQQLQCKEGSR